MKKLRRAVVAHIHGIDAAALDNLFDEVRAVAIAHLAIIRHREDQQVGLLAHFDGADRIRAADGVGGVDGGGGNGLRGSQFQVAAGQRYRELHGLVPGGAGVAVGGEGEDGVRFDEFARGCVIAFGQAEGRAGK